MPCRLGFGLLLTLNVGVCVMCYVLCVAQYVPELRLRNGKRWHNFCDLHTGNKAIQHFPHKQTSTFLRITYNRSKRKSVFFPLAHSIWFQVFLFAAYSFVLPFDV